MSETGLVLREALGQNTFVLGFSNGLVSYLPTPEVSREGGMEAKLGYKCERRSKSAARGGVARPVEKCSAQLCSGVGQDNRGGAAITPYRERGTRSVCRHGEVDRGSSPSADRRVVEAGGVPGVRTK